MKIFFAVLGALIALFLLTWLIQGQDFFMHKFWDPKYEDVRREVFEHSHSYKQGNIQELEKMALDYNKASDSEKDALASVILHRAGDIDEAILPQDLRAFISDLRRERMGR